jgi:hypothetical protein
VGGSEEEEKRKNAKKVYVVWSVWVWVDLCVERMGRCRGSGIEA